MYVTVRVCSVALPQVCACRVHMLSRLSHSERLLLDELLISQNRTHEATHIIIGEAAVDGVIYCRVSCACVRGKGCIWIDLLHVSTQCMAALLVCSCFLKSSSCLCSPLSHLSPIALLFSYLFACLRLPFTRYHTWVSVVFVISEWTLKLGCAMQRAIRIERVSLKIQWWRGVVYP